MGDILITGGSGFLGQHLVRKLVVDNHAVRCLDIADYANRPSGVEYIEGSFLDESLLKAALRGCKTVYHLACTVVPRSSNENPHFDVVSNLGGSIRLLERAMAAGVERIIFVSSGGTVYGQPQGDIIEETHPTDPLCSYGVTKLAIEKYLKIYAVNHGLQSVALRLSNPYGENQRPEKGVGVIAAFCKSALLNQPLEIWGDGSVARDFVYVEDVARALALAMNVKDDFLLANIGSGCATSLNELIEIIEAKIGKPVERNYLPARSFDVSRVCLSIERARKKLNWSPEVGLDDGIGRVLEKLSEDM